MYPRLALAVRDETRIGKKPMRMAVFVPRLFHIALKEFLYHLCAEAILELDGIWTEGAV